MADRYALLATTILSLSLGGIAARAETPSANGQSAIAEDPSSHGWDDVVTTSGSEPFSDFSVAPGPAPQAVDATTANLVAGHSRSDRRPIIYPLPITLALRGGFWAIDDSGDSVKTGEFQSLDSSAFWDVDGLWTNGSRTLDYFATGLDKEGTQAGMRYYGPGASARAEYQRFLRRWDHDPLDNMPDYQEQDPGGNLVFKEDLNPGQDYAIRVQTLNAHAKGRLTNNLKWRLNIWGMRKKGDRQVNAIGHCFSHPDGMDVDGNPATGRACHVLTQRQRIDWLTTEIQPVVEAQLGAATVQYSHTMRTFSQDDELTTRDYNRFGYGEDVPYAVVPDNYTEIDRLRLDVLLSQNVDVYGNLYTGNTLNRNRRTNRRFWGFDLRTTARFRDGGTLTGYARKNVQTNQLPSTLLPEEDIDDIRHPVDYDQSIAGIKGRWRPFYGEWSWRGTLNLSGGYEYRGLARQYALFSSDSGTVDQSQTNAHWLHLRAGLKWTTNTDGFVRYRVGFIDDPLYGLAPNDTTNSNLPTQEHNVEIGGTWMPSDAFLMSATLGVRNRWQTSETAYFSEDDYPITFTTWYSPTERWSISGGLAFFSNWIDQDITLGPLTDPLTLPWEYSGKSNVVNVGTTYAWNNRTTLTGGFEYVWGRNGFRSLEPWPDLPIYSDVLVEITRWTAGIDYELTAGIDAYFRYQYFDYEDLSQNYNSGTANMFLAGVSGVY